MINECCNIHNLEDLTPLKHRKIGRTKSGSGVSIGGSDMRWCTASLPISPFELSRPQTPSGGRSTALEKLARGLKTIGRSQTDVIEISAREGMLLTSYQKPHKVLRKMRSMGDRSLKSAHGGDSPEFDAQEMRHHRLAYEAGQKRLDTGHRFEV
jgi:hypothetical protein